LIASSCSQRQIVDADASVIPRSITSRCSSAREKRPNGRPCTTGSSHAIASLGLLTVNALVASSEVLVPVDMTDEGALQGAAEVRGIVARLARRNVAAIRALIRTAVDRRRVVYQRMSDGLGDLGLPIAQTEIPLTAAFQNAAADRRPLLAARPDSVGSIAYWQLARELLPTERTEAQ